MTRPPIHPGVLWAAIVMLLILVEGITVGTARQGDTLSEVVYVVRHDALGRWLVLTVWCWLSWHWMLRPASDRTISWVDAAAILCGLAWAAWESWRAR